MTIWPMAPSAIACRAFHHCGAEVVCEPTCKMRPVARTVSIRLRASATVWHMGFSR